MTEYDVPLISDHSPMLLSLCTTQWNGKIPFRFFNVWTEHAFFMSIVKDGWAKSLATGRMKNIWRQTNVEKTE